MVAVEELGLDVGAACADVAEHVVRAIELGAAHSWRARILARGARTAAVMHPTIPVQLWPVKIAVAWSPRGTCPVAALCGFAEAPWTVSASRGRLRQLVCVARSGPLLVFRLLRQTGLDPERIDQGAQPSAAIAAPSIRIVAGSGTGVGSPVYSSKARSDVAGSGPRTASRTAPTAAPESPAAHWRSAACSRSASAAC